MVLNTNILNLSTLTREVTASFNYAPGDLVKVDTAEGTKMVPFSLLLTSITQRSKFIDMEVENEEEFIDMKRVELAGAGAIYREYDRQAESDIYYFITPKSWMVLQCKVWGFTNTTAVSGRGENLNDGELVNLILNSNIPVVPVLDVKTLSDNEEVIQLYRNVLVDLKGVGGTIKPTFDLTKLFVVVAQLGLCVENIDSDRNDYVINEKRHFNDTNFETLGHVLSQALRHVRHCADNLAIFFSDKDNHDKATVWFPNGSELRLCLASGQPNFSVQWSEGEVECTDEVKDDYIRRLQLLIQRQNNLLDMAGLVDNSGAIDNLCGNVLYTTFRENPTSQDGWFRSRKGKLLFIHSSGMEIKFTEKRSYGFELHLNVSSAKELTEDQIFDALEDFLSRSKRANTAGDTNTREEYLKGAERKPEPLEDILRERTEIRKTHAREALLETIDTLALFAKNMRENPAFDLMSLQRVVEDLYRDTKTYTHLSNEDLRSSGLYYEPTHFNEGSYKARTAAMENTYWDGKRP